MRRLGLLLAGAIIVGLTFGTACIVRTRPARSTKTVIVKPGHGHGHGHGKAKAKGHGHGHGHGHGKKGK